MKRRMKQLLAVLAMFASVTCAAQSTAPSLPKDDRPIRIVVITSPGGSADLLGRVLADKLSTRLGRTFIVDNKVGAGGNIASEFVAHAPPDGNTWLLTANNHNINAALYPKVPYDPEKDFVSIIQLGRGPSVLAVHPSVKANTLPALIALAKAEPNTLSYGSGGIGNPGHIQGELFKSLAGVQLIHVPYKGAGPAMADAVGGQVPVVFGSLGSAMPFIKGNQLRVLGVTGARRSDIAPTIPTIAEGGVPGYQYDLWWGLFASKGTPQALANAYNEEVNRVLAMPDVREKLLSYGIEPFANSTKEFEVMLKDDLARSIKLVKSANIKPE